MSALESQATISAEIAALTGGADTVAQPLLDYPPYRSSRLRSPTHAPVGVDPEGVELWAPVFGAQDVSPFDSDLTIQHRGEPLGERMIVTGRITDGAGRPVRHQLVEVWQANAAGRYVHQRDQHSAPLDPNFTGAGRALTDGDGRYRFLTVKPGPYPWRNHDNAWRPAHIHFSLFGTDFTQRVITQMYFPGDPLFPLDPILQSVTDPAARKRLVATYDHTVTRAEYCTGYRWDIVLTGDVRTPDGGPGVNAPTPGQTIGPFFGFALPYPGGPDLVGRGHPGAIRLHGDVLDGDGAPVPDALIEIGQADPTGALVRRPGSLHRDGWTFTGWGRAATDDAGHYSFTTLPPGGPNPFFAVTVFARGLLDRLATRAYLPGHEPDTLLSGVAEQRRHTLIAVAEPDGLRFDVRLQGQDETVFLAFPGADPRR